jgi:hypothetical protein
MNGKLNGCLIFFALPFAAVGAGMAIWLFTSLYAYRQTQAWVEVPAKILKVEFTAHAGDDGSTYQTTAEYQYEYDKTTFRGTRVGLESGSDNIGSFQQTVYQELKSYRDQEKPFRCYINPNHPDRSILYRNLRWAMVFFKMLFVVVFGGFGFGMLAGSLLTWRNQPGTAGGPDALKKAPWLARTDWANGMMVYSGSTKAMIGIVISLAWNVAAAPVWMAGGGLLPWPGGLLDWAVGAIAIVGMLLLFWAASATRTWLRYGKTVFQMAAVPGVIGGRLAGAIQIGIPARPRDTFRLSLRCVRRITTRRGEDSSTIEDIQWRGEQTIASQVADDASDSAVVPVSFSIPYDCRPTQTTSSNDTTFWRLEIVGQGDHSRYRAHFNVPVFETPDSDPNFKADDFRQDSGAEQSDLQQDLATAGVILSAATDGDGLRFFFPSGRNRGMAIGFTVFSAVWTGVIWAMWTFGAPLFVTGIFSLFGAIILPIMFDLWLYQSTVDVSPEKVVVQAGWLGLGGRREVAAGDVTKIDAVQGMTSNSRVFYSLVLVLGNCKRVAVAKRIPGHRTAQGVIRAIEDAMGRGHLGPIQRAMPDVRLR